MKTFLITLLVKSLQHANFGSQKRKERKTISVLTLTVKMKWMPFLLTKSAPMMKKLLLFMLLDNLLMLVHLNSLLTLKELMKFFNKITNSSMTISEFKSAIVIPTLLSVTLNQRMEESSLNSKRDFHALKDSLLKLKNTLEPFWFQNLFSWWLRMMIKESEELLLKLSMICQGNRSRSCR